MIPQLISDFEPLSQPSWVSWNARALVCVCVVGLVGGARIETSPQKGCQIKAQAQEVHMGLLAGGAFM